MLPPLLGALDEWIAGQPERPTRPEAARRLIERGLAAPAGPEQLGATVATAVAQERDIAPEELNAENDPGA